MMKSSTDTVSSLSELGLNEAQISIYQVLAKDKNLSVQQIAQETGIPRTSIYDHLKKLQTLGLVEQVVQQHTTKYRAYPLEITLHVLEDKLSSYQKLVSPLDGIAQIAHDIQDQPAETSTVRYYQGKAGARQLLWNSLNAQDVVYVYSSFGRSKYVGTSFYRRFVVESKRRNLAEKVLTNPTERALRFLKLHNRSELARTESKDVRLVTEKQLPITGEVFIYNDVFAQVNLSNESITGFEIHNKAFAQMQRALFNQVWGGAKKIAERDLSGSKIKS